MSEYAAGLFVPFHLSVPADGLSRVGPAGIAGREIVWIRPNSSEVAVTVSVMIAENTATLEAWIDANGPGTTRLAQMQLPSGRVVCIPLTEQPLDEATREFLANCASAPVDPVRIDEAKRANTFVARELFPCVGPGTGTMAIWDISPGYQNSSRVAPDQ